jgi:hypothetical protein
MCGPPLGVQGNEQTRAFRFFAYTKLGKCVVVGKGPRRAELCRSTPHSQTESLCWMPLFEYGFTTLGTDRGVCCVCV